MRHGQHPRKPSPADVTDAQGAILAPLIPPPRTQRGGRPREVARRDVLHTILYQNRSGCPWARLPPDLLPKSPV
jgi:transposase